MCFEALQTKILCLFLRETHWRITAVPKHGFLITQNAILKVFYAETYT